MVNRGKRLLILRHGEAEPPTPSTRDYDRPLTEQGKRKLIELGSTLRESSWLPDRILVSSAIRAKETCHALLNGMNLLAEPPVQVIPSFYLGGVHQMMTEAAQLDSGLNTLFFIGHNPGWSEALSFLTRDYLILSPGQGAGLLAHDSSQTWVELLASPATFKIDRIFI